MDEREATDHLKLRNIDNEVAKQIYEAVGGRPIKLQAAAVSYERHGNFESMCIIQSIKTGLVSHYFYSDI